MVVALLFLPVHPFTWSTTISSSWLGTGPGSHHVSSSTTHWTLTPVTELAPIPIDCKINLGYMMIYTVCYWFLFLFFVLKFISSSVLLMKFKWELIMSEKGWKDILMPWLNIIIYYITWFTYKRIQYGGWPLTSDRSAAPNDYDNPIIKHVYQLLSFFLLQYVHKYRLINRSGWHPTYWCTV